MADFLAHKGLDVETAILPEELQKEFKVFKEGYVRNKCLAVHAEDNAITLSRTDIQGAMLFSTTLPCPDCAKKIVQSGISAVVCAVAYKDDQHGRPTLGETVEKLFTGSRVPSIFLPVPEDYLEIFFADIKNAGKEIAYHIAGVKT